MYGARTVEAKLEVPGAEVLILHAKYPEQVDHTFSDDTHLMALYLSPLTSVECRYVETGAAEFTPLGSLFFRPANLHMHSRGAAGLRRAIHCKITPSRFEQFGGKNLRWEQATLKATLDLRPQLRFRSFMMRLMEEIQFPSFGSTTVVDAIIGLLINDIINLPNSKRASSDRKMPYRERLLRIVRDRVADIWEVSPTVGELSALTNVCERHLLRVFKAQTGSSLIDYIRQSRAEKAQQLVATTRLSLKEVAYRLGFSSHASFSTAFVREIGMSPIDFRREHSHLNRPTPSGPRGCRDMSGEHRH